MVVPFRHRKLGYVALNVTDLDRSAAFYHDIVGLDLTERVNGVAFLRCSHDHHNVALYAGDTPGVKRVGFELESDEQFERAFGHYTDIGLDPQEVGDNELAVLQQGRTFRVREPNMGLTVEYYSAIQYLTAPFGQRLVKIARLGHLVLGAEDAGAAVDFLTGSMGFRVSDRIGDALAFLRCFPNPFHHSLAIGPSATNGLNHVNFMVTEIDDIGRSMHRLNAADVPVVYGPGRHPPSGSVFLYFLDPDGMTLEYSYGMEEFPEEGARKPRQFKTVRESFDEWGGPQDPRFASVGTIEAA